MFIYVVQCTKCDAAYIYRDGQHLQHTAEGCKGKWITYAPLAGDYPGDSRNFRFVGDHRPRIQE